MRKIVFLLVAAAMVFMVPSVEAQQAYPLGRANVALKLDYLRFTSSEVEDLGLENAMYIGGEVFFPVWRALYLGLETGYAWSSGDVDVFGFDVDLDLGYVPIEFNAKYVFELSPCLTLDFGAGIFYSYLNIDASVNGLSADEDDWVFGGQFFADLNYKVGRWFVGANIKYQITEDISLGGIDTDVSADNFRVGGQVGFLF
ncbi:MAG: porin family protein [Deltaproteobacteria bacterium]|nr:porin family protein [Deltaproteobacteria bacterium]